MLNLRSYDVVLGSASPRRKALLESLNISFEVRKVSTKETVPPTTRVEDVAEYLAGYKGELLISRLPINSLLITADTVVILDKEILGKPRNKIEAREMLTKLSGRRHEVVTGVCIQDKDQKVSFSDTTVVTFHNLLPGEVNYYVDNFQVLDKAGAYGIQDWIGKTRIARIEGSYYNVMGLPVDKVYEALLGWSA